MMCYGAGGSILATALAKGSPANLPATTLIVVVSAAIAAFGAGTTAQILFNDKISDNLYKKINDIYEKMGYDFKEEVEKAYKQQHKSK